MKLCTRHVFALITLLCAALLAYGYYLQYHDGLEPCPLCIFQRVCYFAAGGFALLGALHGRAPRIYALLVGTSALAGAVFAARQVWLQHLPPDKVPECGPGLDYWMQTLPLAETFKRVFRGTGECTAVDWTFLTLSIAEWSLIMFSVITLITLYLLFTARTR